MIYNFNNIKIAIPDTSIEKYMKDLQITKEEAIELAGSLKKEKKQYTRKPSDEKVAIFIELKNWLDTLCENDNFKYEILKENKLISLTTQSGTQFKIDLIETRKK